MRLTIMAGLLFASGAGVPRADRLEGPAGEHRIGIWTYGKPLDPPDSERAAFALDDATLRLLAARNVYFVFGVNADHLNDALVGRLTRCREHGIEVHLSVTPTAEGLDFVNIWSFPSLRPEIESVLAFLNDRGFLDGTITTLVYDMEALPQACFPTYGLRWEILHGLRRYDEVQCRFREFNGWVTRRYGLRVRICTDIYQALDPLDGDDDLCRLWGLMSDGCAQMSYMAYRRGDFGPDYVRAHSRLLRNGDTVILNAWKERSHACWGDLDCAIADAREVVGFPNKGLHVEIWALWYFLKAYGVDGLRAWVDALAPEPSEWGAMRADGAHPVAEPAWPAGPTATDALILGIRVLDWIAPAFRAVYGVL